MFGKTTMSSRGTSSSLVNASHNLSLENYSLNSSFNE
jgi:hypothetical protein